MVLSIVDVSQEENDFVSFSLDSSEILAGLDSGEGIVFYIVGGLLLVTVVIGLIVAITRQGLDEEQHEDMLN